MRWLEIMIFLILLVWTVFGTRLTRKERAS